MKRKIAILFVIALAFSGCTNSNKNGNQGGSTKQEEFLEEYYTNYPSVQNIVKYLGLTSKDVNVLQQTDNDLIFSFAMNSDSETEKSYKNYVKLLEDEGFEAEILDATISQTIILKKDKYTISITDISDLEEWKKVHKDKSWADKIKNDNIVYEINVED